MSIIENRVFFYRIVTLFLVPNGIGKGLEVDNTACIFSAFQNLSHCGMMPFVPGGGPKSCNHGCLGYGNCVNACPFDAIHIINGIAKVDEAACKACGKCIEACPKGLIELIPATAKTRVACFSKDAGPVAMKTCDSACIGCGICVKNCPAEAIKVENFVAHIDYDKCTNCGTCVSKCPKKAIIQ